MVQQKIVIEVPLTCEKCRTKAMTIAAGSDGVVSVTIQRNERDQVVIIGEGVDATMVTKGLRKKLKYASLVSVDKA
ncbi:heavy metal-associated isoprenylated plant protein 47-like [Senna tora]|uniref:Heavy metal-associated isoprenylated plant protein 47-like n=1 Tax=Senna tora TaxID=362788 RepID=A0A834T4D2_9FABA|nr:heavy metal-associated isoprenylated plant protein 47-like [Senna tora]